MSSKLPSRAKTSPNFKFFVIKNSAPRDLYTIWLWFQKLTLGNFIAWNDVRAGVGSSPSTSMLFLALTFSWYSRGFDSINLGGVHEVFKGGFISKSILSLQLGAVHKWSRQLGRRSKLTTDSTKKTVDMGVVGVKNTKKLPTSFMDGPLSLQ